MGAFRLARHRCGDNVHFIAPGVTPGDWLSAHQAVDARQLPARLLIEPL